MLCYNSTFPKDEGKTTKQPLRPLQKICEVKNHVLLFSVSGTVALIRRVNQATERVAHNQRLNKSIREPQADLS